MSSFLIRGGKQLHGQITTQGSKNEALQVICVALLTDEPVELFNVPDITDVRRLIEIIVSLGCSVISLDDSTYRITNQAKLSNALLAESEIIQKITSIRGSIMLVAPLLIRHKKVTISSPGGDKIGRRKLDVHFEGMAHLGVKIRYKEEEKLYYLVVQKIVGQEFIMDEASVTGTANLIMIAVFAEGITTIHNAACEPYIQQLCHMLIRMGAIINGIGSNKITIKGVTQLGGTTHKLLPDMIEVGSFIGLAAMTRSTITIRDCRPDMLGIIPRVFQKIGVPLVIEGEDISVPAKEELEIEHFMDGSILNISDAPWPGLSPDLLSVILVVATQAKGSVLIHQKMFESRLFFVDKLIDMGAQIILCDPHRAVVIGLNRRQSLRGIVASSPDIRAGIALLVAALSAQGESNILGIEQIERGYQDIEQRLRKLGADIERIA